MGSFFVEFSDTLVRKAVGLELVPTDGIVALDAVRRLLGLSKPDELSLHNLQKDPVWRRPVPLELFR